MDNNIFPTKFFGTFSMVAKRANIVVVLALSLMMVGCSANTWVWDSSGNLLYHIKTNGAAIHKVKTTDIEIETDGKTEPLFKFDLSANKVGT